MDIGLILLCVTLPVGVCSVAMWLLWRVERTRRATEFEDVSRGGEQIGKPGTGCDRREVGLTLSSQPSSPCSPRGVPRSSGGQHHRPCDAASSQVLSVDHAAVVAMLGQEATAARLPQRADSRGALGAEAEHASRAGSGMQAAEWPSIGPQLLLPAATLSPPPPQPLQQPRPRAAPVAPVPTPQRTRRASILTTESGVLVANVASPRSLPGQHGEGHKLEIDAAIKAALMTKAMLMPDEVLHHATVARDRWHSSAGLAISACHAFNAAPSRAAKAGVSLQRTARLATAAGGPSAAEAYPQPPVAAGATPQHLPSASLRNSLDSQLDHAAAPAAPAAAAPAPLPAPPHNFGCSQSWLDLPVSGSSSRAASPLQAAQLQALVAVAAEVAAAAPPAAAAPAPLPPPPHNIGCSKSWWDLPVSSSGSSSPASSASDELGQGPLHPAFQWMADRGGGTCR